MSPLPEPELMHIGVSDKWVLKHPCEAPVGNGYILTVPEGFIYDLASIPQFGPFMWLVGEDDELSTLAPLVHDVLYRYKGDVPEGWLTPFGKKFSRREADDLLYQLAVRQGCKPWRAKLAWWAVRLFACRRWEKKAREELISPGL